MAGTESAVDDSPGLGRFVAPYAAGGVLQIAHANRRIRRLLDVTGLLKLLAADP